jgi:hypothetical protein
MENENQEKQIKEIQKHLTELKKIINLFLHQLKEKMLYLIWKKDVTITTQQM